MITNELFLERSKSPLKECRIPFIMTKSDIPFVVFTMEDERDIVAMLDSGACSTLISPFFRKEFPDAIQSSEPVKDFKMEGIGGTIVTITNKTVLTLSVRAEDGSMGKITLKGHESDLYGTSSALIKDMGYPETVSMVIGSDAFLKYGALIDFKNQELVLFV